MNAVGTSLNISRATEKARTVPKQKNIFLNLSDSISYKLCSSIIDTNRYHRDIGGCSTSGLRTDLMTAENVPSILGSSDFFLRRFSRGDPSQFFAQKFYLCETKSEPQNFAKKKKKCSIGIFFIIFIIVTQWPLQFGNYATFSQTFLARLQSYIDRSTYISQPSDTLDGWKKKKKNKWPYFRAIKIEIADR